MAVSLLVLAGGAVSCMAGQDVPALKELFQDDFLIGGALNRRGVTGRDPQAAALAEKHFSTATADDDLKWQSIHPRPDQCNWGPTDDYAVFCEKDQMPLSAIASFGTARFGVGCKTHQPVRQSVTRP